MSHVENPTDRTYSDLTAAYDFFNARLFDGRLPRCLVTLQRKNKARGYFAGERFGSRDGDEVTDEIALNPAEFARRTDREVLSTLVHEMTHLEQHHFGEPSRSGYHNAEWGGLMRAVGLIPSDTGEPGGKATGQRMTHYIEQGGRFDVACAELIGNGFAMAYVDRWDEGRSKRREQQSASKTKFVCPSCGANAWARPTAALVCGGCSRVMV